MSVRARAALVRSKTSGSDPLVDKILTEGSAEAELYTRSLAINKSKIKKSYVESSLLATKNTKTIADLLGIDLELIEFYRDVFYDVGDLDKLSRLELIEVDDQNERLMKLWAISQGLEFIAWRLGENVTINPVEGLQDLFSTCIMKSKEAMFSGNGSEVSKNSTAWVKLSMDIARLLRNWVMDNEGARKDIELALRESNPEFEGFASLQELDSTDAVS